MIPYFILLIIFLIISLFKSKIGDSRYLKIIFIILFLFIILKDYHYFPDHNYYEELFHLFDNFKLGEILNMNRFEKGYILYNYIICLFINNYYLYLCITSAISLSGFYYFIKNNSKDYFMSLLIFITCSFFSMNFYLLRSTLALSIWLFSIKSIKEKNFWKYLCLTILAGLFHKTIFIFIPLYFLLNINYNYYKLLIFNVFCILLFIFRKIIVKSLISAFYNYYDGINTSGGYNFLILLVFLVSLILYHKKRLIDQDKNNNFYINMILFSIPFQIMSISFGSINRIVRYFLVSLIILLPSLLKMKNENNKKYYNLLKAGFITFLIVYFCISVYRGLPYCEYHIYRSVF